MGSLSSMGNKSVSLDKCHLFPFSGPLSGTPVDISGSVARIEIYESLFSPVLSGKMEIQDSESMSTVLNMFGLDVVAMQFSVADKATNTTVRYGDDSAPLKFAAFSQTNRMPFSFGSEMFSLHLASAEMYSSAGIKISKSFKNMRVEEIIKTMLDTPEFIGAATKNFDAQITDVPVTMVTPYLSPLEIIRLATLMAYSGDESNYLFYETLKGFNFKSIRKIVEEASQKPIPTLKRGITGVTDSKADLRTIYVDQIDIVKGFDLLDTTSGGFFASMTVGLDVLSGRARKTISRASDMKTIVNQGQGSPNFPTAFADVINPTSRIFLIPTLAISAQDMEMASLDPSIHDNKFEDNLDGRTRELMALNSRVVRVKMTGVPNIHAGSLVDIVIPSPKNNNKGVADFRDIATGRYLVVAVSHTLVAGDSQGFFYETVIEACSDSVF